MGSLSYGMQPGEKLTRSEIAQRLEHFRHSPEGASGYAKIAVPPHMAKYAEEIQKEFNVKTVVKPEAYTRNGSMTMTINDDPDAI